LTVYHVLQTCFKAIFLFTHRDKREVTLIVLGITALVAALAEISYGVIVNHVTAKKPNQSGRGHLRPGRPCS
jgi:hypothetical protein